MASFRYQALDENGKTVSGVQEADSERQVRTQLRARRLKPLEVTAVAATVADGGTFLNWVKPRHKLSVAQLSLISRQLASLVQSGLPLDEALQISARQSRNMRVKGILSQVRSRVMEGQTLAQSMAEHPVAFDRMYCAMVRAGESAGFLGQVLERLAEYTESGQQSRQKLQMALIYPLVLLGVSLLVVVLLMTFVVPRLVSMFATSNRELPGLTKALIVSSDFLSSVWALVLLGGIVSAVIAFRWWLREQQNRLRWHKLLLRMPFLSENLRQMDRKVAVSVKACVRLRFFLRFWCRWRPMARPMVRWRGNWRMLPKIRKEN